ncbi:DoxX family protein [Actinomadura sp. B10D3]|uniref:DoxX family protein n=1 Tax=Actinomadura sp. B10D3 TaxID=3153557 RepID=UPI00325F6335
MFATYVLVTVLAAAVNGLAAIANFIGHPYPQSQADKLRVPRTWMLPLGTLLAAGALGLVTGFAVPPLGTLAATGLVLYFLGAFVVHLRARDYHLGAWSVFFSLDVAALTLNATHHGL